MRRCPVAGEDVELVDDLLADIAVQVVACGDDDIRSDDGTRRMVGSIKSYDPATGIMEVNVDSPPASALNNKGLS